MTERVDAARLHPGVLVPVAYALWHLAEAREWTLRWVDGISQAALDMTPDNHRHSVATLLYHIAVFEVDWVHTDILGAEYDMELHIPGCPPELAAVLPHPLLLDDHVYTPVSGESLATHLDRLQTVRDDLVSVFEGMSIEDFRTPRPSDDGSVTPEWVLMHLARHESEHRGQIWEARLAAERQLAN